MAEERKSVSEVAGETLFEIGFFWTAFFMLDDLIEGEQDFSHRFKLVVIAACILLVAFGIYLECRRSAEDEQE